MRSLRLHPSPKSRRLRRVPIGTTCAAALAASPMGTSSPHASPSTSRAVVTAAVLSAAWGTISGASAGVTDPQILRLSAAEGVAALTLDRSAHLLATADVAPAKP